MMFCEKCGSIMVLKGDPKKKYMACTRCIFKKKDIQEMKINEEVKDKSKPIEVVDKEIDTDPIVDEDRKSVV